MPAEELPAGLGGGQLFRQQVHVAARRVKVVAQHRAEQTQLADAVRTAKRRDLLAIKLDGQFGNAHNIYHYPKPFYLQPSFRIAHPM